MGEEQARIEERKAIGEALDELAMKTYSGKIPMWLVKCICELEHGESLRGEQPKEA